MSFQVFDATWGGDRFGSPVFWTGQKGMGNADRDARNASIEDIRAYAEAIHTGSAMRVQKSDGWIGSFQAQKGSIPLLDFEGIYDRGVIVRHLKMFHEVAPSLRVGFYPFALIGAKTQFDGNIDALVSQPGWLVKWQNAAKEYTRPIVKLLDYLSPDCYMLGPNTFDRDIKRLSVIAKIFGSYDKMIYPVVWGIWHPGPELNGDGIPEWNPPRCREDHDKPWKSPDDGVQWYTRPSADQYAVMIEAMEKEFDGCIVWGPRDQNTEFIDSLKLLGHL